MFSVATEDESDLLKFILGSGLRAQEHRTVEYVDLDFRHDLARVTAKPTWDFTSKNWEERIVPLPSADGADEEAHGTEEGPASRSCLLQYERQAR
jgi:integrase